MANRNFYRVQSVDKEIKKLYANITVGATGAPTLVSGVGITSITRTSQGLYQLILNDKFVNLRYFSASLLDLASEDIVFQVKAEDVDGARTIDFFTNTAATATDPSNGATMILEISVKNSSVR